ncbi:MAG: hypothetical protein RIR73_1585 [Chloroflexota bacterium]|jgi:hypothetical protein
MTPNTLQQTSRGPRGTPGVCSSNLAIIFHVHFSEAFHQQTVDEDVSATDAAQEDLVNAVVEEVDKSPWKEVVAGGLFACKFDHSFQ